MPAKDTFHDAVKTALIKDGWSITHDPLKLKIGKKDLYVDLGAERLLAAESATEKIAIDTKSFMGHSEMDALEMTVGGYILYQDIIAKSEPDRRLYLAISESGFVDLFEEPAAKLLLENRRLQLIVFKPDKMGIVRLIS